MVIVSLLYLFSAYAGFHRKALLLDMGKPVMSSLNYYQPHPEAFLVLFICTFSVTFGPVNYLLSLSAFCFGIFLIAHSWVPLVQFLIVWLILLGPYPLISATPHPHHSTHILKVWFYRYFLIFSFLCLYFNCYELNVCVPTPNSCDEALIPMRWYLVVGPLGDR